MEYFLQGFIASFRESLEALLIIAIFLSLFKGRADKSRMNGYIFLGAFLGILFSILIGYVVHLFANNLESFGVYGKVWEAVVSLIASILIIYVVVWMMKNSHNIKDVILRKHNLANLPLVLMAVVMFAVLREGLEIVLFQFAGKYPLLSIILGFLVSLFIGFLILKSAVRVDLHLILNITLLYLILQAGFLFGYSIHEGVSSLKAVYLIEGGSLLTEKAFDLSGTVLDSKSRFLGIGLNALFGWYHKPEWIQLIAHLALVVMLMVLWRRDLNG